MARSVALACAALLGCGQLGTYRTAEPLGAGRWRVGAAASATGFVDVRDDVRTPSGQVELSVRRGVSAVLDLGASVFARGAAVDAQLALGRHRGWALAVHGALGASVDRQVNVIGDGVYGHARLGALATHALGARWSVTTGAQLVLSRYWADGGGHASGGLIGGFANLARALRAGWSLVPELTLLATAFGDVPVAGAVGQLGLGVARRW